MPDPLRHRVAPGERFSIAEHDTSHTGPYASEEEAGDALEGLLGRLNELQDRFAAQASHALLVVLQGFDGAGKDSIITNVMAAFDPAILHVYSFNKPVGSESQHDFLWRFHAQTPARGFVHVFDRSYYEQVISARVHGEVDEEGSRVRYDSINDFERILVRDDTVIVKVFLHVSKDKQAERVEERLSKPDKHHEFSAADIADRELWPQYDEAYEDAINATSSEAAPWHAVPSDHRWYSRTAVAEILVAALEALDPQYPPLDLDEVREAGLDPEDPLRGLSGTD
jgi:PPK2 family polyphosphate:nucleotide phosphotransferase